MPDPALVRPAQLDAPSKARPPRAPAEAALARRAALLAQSEAISHVGSWHVELETGRATWSDELFRIFGLDRGVTPDSDGIRDAFQAAIDPRDRELVARVADETLAGELLRPVEYRILRPDGAVRWVRAQAETEFDEAGHAIGRLGILQDITERRELDAAVAEADDRLARAQRAAGAGLWDWDIATGRMDWSPELFALFGLDPAQDRASFETWNGTLHPDELANAGARITEAVDGHLPLDSEYRIVLPGGEVRWIQALGDTTYDDDGAARKMAGICIDITPRKQVEQSLRASHAFSRQVIDSAGEGIIVYGRDLCFQVWNHAMEAITGMPAGQVLGRHPVAVFPELAPTGVIANVERALAGERPEPLEFHLTLPGRETWVVDTSAPLRDEHGEIIGVIAIVEDITTRRHAEDTSTANARLVVESQRAAAIGSYRADFVADRWWSSEVLDELFGIETTHERTIEAWLDLIHPDDSEDMQRYLAEEVIGRGRPFNHEYRVIRKADGAIRWVNGLGEVTRAADGTAITLIGTIQDVTDRRLATEERERLMGQLQQAERMEAIGRLAGGVAHDFNNMLGAIIGYAELALDRVDPADETYADLLEIQRAASRSAELTGQLLAYARRQAITPRVIDLDAAIESDLKLLRRLLGEHVRLDWRPRASGGHVRIDPSQVDRILTNLCINARDAIDGEGEIVIETRLETLDEGGCEAYPGCLPGEYVALAVTDTGRGMDAATLANVFEPFFTTKATGEGTGLGLASVQGIVSQAGGFIDVETAPGRGSTFRVRLPRHVGLADATEARADASEAGAGGATVLLVEDEPALRTVTRRILRHLGYEVIAAATPIAALELFLTQTHRIDVLLTDVVMPEMNGHELARRLRELDPGLRCVFMSGYPADSLAGIGSVVDGAPFIQKPFSVGALAEGIRAALAQAGPSAGEVQPEP